MQSFFNAECFLACTFGAFGSSRARKHKAKLSRKKFLLFENPAQNKPKTKNYVSIASFISRSGATTRLTSPHSIAVFASSTRAVNSISAARA